MKQRVALQEDNEYLKEKTILVSCSLAEGYIQLLMLKSFSLFENTVSVRSYEGK